MGYSPSYSAWAGGGRRSQKHNGLSGWPYSRYTDTHGSYVAPSCMHIERHGKMGICHIAIAAVDVALHTEAVVLGAWDGLLAHGPLTSAGVQIDSEASDRCSKYWPEKWKLIHVLAVQAAHILCHVHHIAITPGCQSAATNYVHGP